ncbi:MAG: ATP-binding protein [Bacteroidales bacterium]|nr:ATP-binding protein [Bacteroidales bacterium]
MFIERDLTQEIKNGLQHYPIVVITGARQTGKTTLVKKIIEKEYLNLESPEIRELAKNDPNLFLKNISKKGAIIDEFQRVPELASYLQVVVDEKKQNGQFILTGSNNFLLMKNISQSLAGRVALLKLLPLTIKELTNQNITNDLNNLLYNGFYPAIYSENRNPTQVYNFYYQTYIERDLRQLINIKDINNFQTFMKLCAGRIGQELNIKSLSNDIGISFNTIKEWLSVLSASYIIFLLPPYFENINKRVIKSPKLYFYDVGLASYLLGNENPRHIETHPLRGNLFENLVILEYLKYRYNKGLENNAFFYRDNHQNEVDLVVKSGNNYLLIEIKSASTYNNGFKKNLDWLEKNINGNVIKKIIIYSGQKEWKDDQFEIINYLNFIKSLKQNDF